jgi:hypothetical protein
VRAVGRDAFDPSDGSGLVGAYYGAPLETVAFGFVADGCETVGSSGRRVVAHEDEDEDDDSSSSRSSRMPSAWFSGETFS